MLFSGLRMTSTTRCAAAGVALALLTFAPAAEAAGPRPPFQMPFACGQTWEASTYDGHWPDQDSIDLGQWSASDANVSKGEPVLASADGTVLDVFTTSNGEVRVYLDHGGGWVTHYIHLEQVPPLSKGQLVAQGEQIGRVGNSGTEAYHLHYSQLADGKAVRIAFDGALIDTHAANAASYNTWGNGEKLTSANCPMNSFLSLDQGGVRYQMIHKPGTGETKIMALAGDGAVGSSTWSSTWSKGWTHFTPFRIGSTPHYIIYKSSTGEVHFNRGNALGLGFTKLAGGTWSKGWTHFMPFTLGGTPYYIAYNSLYGGANIDRINAAGNGAATVWSGSWGKGWTNLVPFVQNGVQYFLAYHGGTGAVEIDRITGSGNSVTITEVWSSTWSKGWSNIAPVVHNGVVHLVKYKRTTGAVQFEYVNAGGAGTVVAGTGTWTQGWTAFSPFTIGTQGHLLLYKVATGETKVVKLDAAGSSAITVWTGSWTRGWS